SFPFTVDVEEIRKNINSLGTKEEKIKYLLSLRDDYCIHCYNAKDRAIENFRYSQDIENKFERIPYSENYDIEQTHISHSEFVLLLRHIDSISLPFVREELLKLDKDIKEESDILINDYELFGFDINKVLNHSNTLKEHRILYLQGVKTDYEEYFKMRYRNDFDIDVNYEIRNSVFLKEIDDRINAIKRCPNREFPNLTKEKVKNESSEITEKPETTNKEIIKLHWQDDNSLVPYLFKLLYDEGLISSGDFEDRRQFIEQTILKKNGEIFTAKEVSAYESSYVLNKGDKPKKSAKVERVTIEMKSKSLDLKSEKRKSKQ
ncbi:MAG: hypothetical protein ACOYN6_14160, partial [Ignavibacteria bacterium]